MQKLTAETFNESINWLQKFHKFDLSAGAKDQYLRGLADIGDDEFAGATSLWCAKAQPMPNKFPTIGDLRSKAMEIREIVWQKQKKNTPTLARGLTAEKTERGKQAIKLMLDLTSGKMSRENYLAGMKSFDWHSEAEELCQWWASEPERHKQGARVMERIEAGREGRSEVRDPKCGCPRCVAAREHELPSSHMREL